MVRVGDQSRNDSDYDEEAVRLSYNDQAESDLERGLSWPALSNDEMTAQLSEWALQFAHTVSRHGRAYDSNGPGGHGLTESRSLPLKGHGW